MELTYTQTVITFEDVVNYTYDHAMRRVSKTRGPTTTFYPSFDYSVEGSNTTVYVQGPSGLTATMEDDGATSTTSTIHTDHLGSTSVVTDEDGIMVELLDYYPYGSERISWSFTASEAESHKTYIGEYSDDETGLSYLNARYYDPHRGQFLSQDTVSVNLGVDERTEAALLNPQLQNAFSYGANNPIKNTDKEGEFLDVLVDVAFIAYDTYRIIDAMINDGDTGTEARALGADIVGALIPGATGLGLGVRSLDKAGDVVKVADRMADARSAGKIGEVTSGAEKNTQRIPSLSGTAQYRIPDTLDIGGKTIGEVKNVTNQSLTNQLRDFIGFAQQTRSRLTLFVRENTQLTKPLQSALESVKATVQRILPKK